MAKWFNEGGEERGRVRETQRKKEGGDGETERQAERQRQRERERQRVRNSLSPPSCPLSLSLHLSLPRQFPSFWLPLFLCPFIPLSLCLWEYEKYSVICITEYEKLYIRIYCFHIFSIMVYYKTLNIVSCKNYCFLIFFFFGQFLESCFSLSYS